MQWYNSYHNDVQIKPIEKRENLIKLHNSKSISNMLVSNKIIH